MDAHASCKSEHKQRHDVNDTCLKCYAAQLNITIDDDDKLSCVNQNGHLTCSTMELNITRVCT